MVTGVVTGCGGGDRHDLDGLGWKEMARGGGNRSEKTTVEDEEIQRMEDITKKDRML